MKYCVDNLSRECGWLVCMAVLNSVYSETVFENKREIIEEKKSIAERNNF